MSEQSRDIQTGEGHDKPAFRWRWFVHSQEGMIDALISLSVQTKRKQSPSTRQLENCGPELCLHQWAEHPTGAGLDVAPRPAEVQRLRDAGPTDTDISCSFHRLPFRPPGEAGVIVDFANSQGVDLVVVGTHGRTGVSHLLAGSVAETIIRSAHRPVIAVK